MLHTGLGAGLQWHGDRSNARRRSEAERRDNDGNSRSQDGWTEVVGERVQAREEKAFFFASIAGLHQVLPEDWEGETEEGGRRTEETK